MKKPLGFMGLQKRTPFLCLACLLCTLVFCLAGCGGYFGRPGESEAEGHRRHLRNLSINQQLMMEDIDRAILADEPSKLSDKKIP